MRMSLVICAIFSWIPGAFAWSDHTTLTYLALEKNKNPALEKKITVESLNHFLQDSLNKNHSKLEQVLQKSEIWAQKNLSGYHPLPDNLKFEEGKLKGQKDLFPAFAQALRVNPHSWKILYRRILKRAAYPKKITEKDLISQKQVVLKSIQDDMLDGMVIQKLKPGEVVTAKSVLLTAADEPDLGLDVGLFADSNTKFSPKYHFGNLPFGDPRVSFASQAPFHYGAYHESKIVYFLNPASRESYSALRIKQYRDLAKFAFATGHDYWGWRFLGLGLHYIQDITQPYHAKFFPGFSVSSMLFLYGLSIVGYKTLLTNKVSVLANRHFLVEDVVQRVLEHGDFLESLALVGALQNGVREGRVSEPKNTLPYADSDPQIRITKRAASQANALSQVIVNTFPAKYVNDPHFIYSKDTAEGLKLFHGLSARDKAQFSKSLQDILFQTGLETQRFIQESLSQKP